MMQDQRFKDLRDLYEGLHQCTHKSADWPDDCPCMTDIKALLWEFTAEDWERGVMYGGGIGTLALIRPENPYRGGR